MSARVRLLSTLAFDDASRARLEAADPRVEVVHRPDADLATLADDEAQILLASDLPPARARLPALRWIQLAVAGVDHVGDAGAWSDVTVTSGSGLYTVPIAEYVLWAVLQAAQGARERDAWRAGGGAWEPRWHLGGRAVRGARLLVLGYGSIGREVARLAAACGMSVVAIKARPDVLADDGFREPDTGDPEGTIPLRVRGLAALRQEAAQADHLVVTLPLTASTRGLVDAEVLAAMPAHAWIVNVGRGAVVDEDALLAALRREALGGAVLDVFREEPLPAGHPLWDEPRAVLTPHVSGRLERWDVVADLVLDNLRRHLDGVPLRNRVELARGY